MKMIRIVLRNGSHYVVDQFKLDAIMSSPNQLVMLTDFSGKSLHKGFNKADIVEFKVDRDATDDVKDDIVFYLRAKEAGKLDELRGKYTEDRDQYRLNILSAGEYAERMGAYIESVKEFEGKNIYKLGMKESTGVSTR